MSRITLSFLSASVAALMLAALSFVATGIQGQDAPEDENPYLARKGLSVNELADFLERMQDKPKTIRKRLAFVEAVVEAAERMLKENPKDEPRKLAALVLFESLHKVAVLDNKEADVKLMKWAEKLKADPVKEIAAAAGLHVWEKRLMDARKKELTQEQAEKLLAELNVYLDKEKLSNRHLRLASLAVGLINDAVKDKKKADGLYDQFGGLLVKSDDKAVKRYGKSILKKPGGKPKGGKGPQLGKTIEIVGKTVDGKDYDLKKLKGKVVLIDFWATWCGPCVREMPNVKANYEKYHEKGFEVVGISLDRDRDALEKYLEDNEIPWTILYEDDANGRHPMALKHGIRAIPTAILVGKDGKVVSTRARGAVLGQLLEKLLAEKADGAEENPAEKKAE